MVIATNKFAFISDINCLSKNGVIEFCKKSVNIEFLIQINVRQFSLNKIKRILVNSFKAEKCSIGNQKISLNQLISNMVEEITKEAKKRYTFKNQRFIFTIPKE